MDLIFLVIYITPSDLDVYSALFGALCRLPFERRDLTTDPTLWGNAQMPAKIAFQSCIPRECRYVPTHTAPFQWNGKDIDPFDARLVTTPFYF